MIKYLFICQSLTYAQRAEKILGRNGIPCAIVRVPERLRGEGCGYGVRVAEKYGYQTQTILSGNGLRIRRVYGITESGDYLEVSF